MATFKKCIACGESFEYVRDDAKFCTPRCAAQWARDEGAFRERFHEEKSEVNSAECEWCGDTFFYNDYAERGGTRRPKFCSNKHRQAAYRARKGMFAGKTSHWDDARDNKKQRTTGGVGGGTEREKQDYEDKQREEQARAKARSDQTYKDTSRGTGAKKQAKDTSRNQQNKDTSQNSRWSSKDAYVVLGVTYLSTKVEIQNAWRALMREWHPDVCKAPNATEVCQAINAAYDKLRGSKR